MLNDIKINEIQTETLFIHDLYHAICVHYISILMEEDLSTAESQRNNAILQDKYTELSEGHWIEWQAIEIKLMTLQRENKTIHNQVMLNNK